ncbi:MAG TPA: dTDP-4-dehydrorhamnose 3,5-epimerase family protein [bacterium]|nr:dTDP-4-dehydrorhamnose 3,5-epimerase family protein [bacterium]
MTTPTPSRIHGSAVRPLAVHPDDRGRLFEILRHDDREFIRFGQVYVTTAFPGVVKAWHFHRKQTDFFCIIQGKARFALYDPRPDSPTRGQVDEVLCDGDRPQLIVIPNLVYHGFKNIGDIDVICINCPTESYDAADPDEERLDPYANDIPYDWRR